MSSVLSSLSDTYYIPHPDILGKTETSSSRKIALVIAASLVLSESERGGKIVADLKEPSLVALVRF